MRQFCSSQYTWFAICWVGSTITFDVRLSTSSNLGFNLQPQHIATYTPNPIQCSTQEGVKFCPSSSKDIPFDGMSTASDAAETVGSASIPFLTRPASSEVSAPTPSLTNLHVSAPPSPHTPRTLAPSTPLRSITNRRRTPRPPFKTYVVLGSPISISSDSPSSEDSDEECSTPGTSPILIVETKLPTKLSTKLATKLPALSHRSSRRSTASENGVIRVTAPTSANALATTDRVKPNPTLKRKSIWQDEPPVAKKAKPQTHLEKFFAGYPRFYYDPTAPVSAQYNAMCRMYFPRPKTDGWGQ
ncbi:hypothetical protein C8R43DRAFT_261975 [Mycena crocata]|nr:hypothetical protein C8R43DRAFT_261975 [Mycena crocata]